MTCERCDQWLEELFDGAEPDAALVDHLVACSGCRELYESAVAMRKGLSEMPRPQPPAELTGRVVSAILFDRRKNQRRRRFVARAAALAAGVLVLLFTSLQKSQPDRPTKPADIVQAPAEPPSLRQLADAGTVAVQGARRQVSEALASTLQLVPSIEELPPMKVEASLAPTMRPLRETGQGVSAGLEPVAGTARRAFALFVRELSPRGKPGL